MAWSLQLRNGDLAHDRGHLATVEGPMKIAQDLRIWILTRLGEDDMHPWFGSSIDGGVDGDQELGSVLDLSNPSIAATLIEAELRRWVIKYKAVQLERIQSDVATYGRTTLRRDEILDDITDVTFRQVADTLFVGVTIKPAEAQPFDLSVAVPT